MSKLRDSARDRACQVRLPRCQHDYGVVLAHYRMSGDGIGRKPPNHRAAFACHSCHNFCDDRDMKYPDGYTRDMIRLAHAEGVFRTQEIWFEEGLIWKLTD